ncbi:hypothetical protein, conserved [Plasmodium gonderi]|uniref:EGF-like domain-containing protein n=1 Tax=Plasmodium gonderi TaxID=77519 RepID=A0A1Y1JGV3_PLAGO|nr:hypothetical protein, conserved [Plasmodium gonderi]GAW80447.1 hypothetical protein, conserved [Plasmodium gonderi]
MSLPLLYLFITHLIINFTLNNAEVVKTQTIKDRDFEIKYEPNSRHLYVSSLNMEKCNSYNYYVNQECKIIHSLEKIDENNSELCVNKNKCLYISNYVFQSLGIESVPEQYFSELNTSIDSDIETKEKCNKKVYINEKVKCICCIKEIENSEIHSLEGELNPIQTNKKDFYPFDHCKCILNYEIDHDNILNVNKCENFICNNGFCTLQMDGEPFCSCSDNYYFDQSVNACIRHEDFVMNEANESVIQEEKEVGNKSERSMVKKNKTHQIVNEKQNDKIYDNQVNEKSINLDNENHNSILPSIDNRTHYYHAQNIQSNHNNRDINNVLTNECLTNQIRNKQGICENVDNSSVKKICFRVECFVNPNKSECLCVDENGQKIENDIFDVSHITICTLNGINCDYGTCINSLEKNELACICDKNYKYNSSLKVCIGDASTSLLNSVLIITLFVIIASAL